MPDLRTRYEEIAAASHRVRQQSLADVTPIDAAHGFVDEVKIWQVVLQDRPEAAIFAQVISGLELGLFALASGLYRQSYGSLRLAVELIAGMSWFSSHRLDLAEWQAGEKDLIWREITNQEEGILSPRYRKAFFPEISEERKYNGLYAKLYRELSEHVHGNARTWASGPDDIVFDQNQQNEWLSKLETFTLVMHVILSLRYLQELSNEHLRTLNPVLRARASQVTAILKYFDDRLPPEPMPANPVGVEGSLTASVAESPYLEERTAPILETEAPRADSEERRSS